MTPLLPDDFGPELLAAYADGELDPVARAAVERWLAEHPEALDEFGTQREFSPTNEPLWVQVEPPQPSSDTWAEVQREIAEAVVPTPAARTLPSRRRVGALLVGGVAAAACVAAAAWVLLPPVPQRRPNPLSPPEQYVSASQPPDPIAEFAVLPVVSEEDVELHRVAGNTARALPVGIAPLSGPMVLAGEDDVEVEGADAHPAWGSDGPKITTGPGDAVMIFAAPQR